MPASRGVNPLATSHTAEHLSIVSLHICSHKKPIFYLISRCLNKKKALLETPDNHQKFFFNIAIFLKFTLGSILEI